MNGAAKAVMVCVAAGVVGVGAGGARGQLIGKVPPASAATPEYVPPTPPPPPPPPKPVEPEKPLPKLAVVESNGKIRRYPQGAERAAVEMYDFDAATREKIAGVEAARWVELERSVAEKVEEVVEARRTLEKLDEVKDFNAFDRAKQVATPLTTERLIDRLMRDGAITPAQRSRLDQMVTEYKTALGEEMRGGTGEDLSKIVGAVAQDAFVKATLDMLTAFDRLLDRAAGRLGGLEETLGLKDDQRAAYELAERAAARAPEGEAGRVQRVEAVRKLVMETLAPEQRKALIGAVAPAKQ